MWKVSLYILYVGEEMDFPYSSLPEVWDPIIGSGSYGIILGEAILGCHWILSYFTFTFPHEFTFGRNFAYALNEHQVAFHLVNKV